MMSCLFKLKVTASFCFAFKIHEEVTETIKYSLSIFQQCKIILFESLLSSCFIKFWIFSTKNDYFYFKSKKKFPEGTDLLDGWIFRVDDYQVNNEIVFKHKRMFLNSETIIPFQIFVSKKWGFTKFERDEFEDLRESGRVRTDGSHCKYLPEHGPLAAWCKIQAELAGI